MTSKITRQSLESKAENLLNKYVANYNLDILGFRQSGQQTLKKALLKTVDRYVEERELLVRIDELEVLSDIAHQHHDYLLPRAAILDSLSALRQQVKGGES